VDALLPLVFWCSVAGLAYIYAGYPVAVWCLSRCRPRAVHKSVRPRSVSIVLIAHNEAATVVRKLDNLLALDDAESICEILVGSDGSTDGTNALVAEYGDPRVQLVPFAERRGKPAVLNDLVPRCTGEIVLFADARQEFDRRCLTELVANFADPTVGVVSGELVLKQSSTSTAAAEGIGWYWRYEKWIRRSESRFRGVPGATGACYAIRRALFRPIGPSTILDDVAIPLSIVTQGFRCVFEPAALAFDAPSQWPQQEAVRKRRTIAGAAQLVRLYPQWLVPWRNPLWWEFVSHKLLRLASPGLLALALAANAALAAQPAYLVLLLVQAAFYASAGWGWWCQRRGRRSRLFGASLMFLTLNLTTLRALWDAARSRYQVTWKKAAS
jgi:cellulose synthase/poly-beta-1,6-N-acetylglucosamine synthase-like glycosyltransferase